MQIKRVGQYDAAERLIRTVDLSTPMKRLFDVDGCDVVGKQDDLVGVQFLEIFSCEIGVPNQRPIEAAERERCRFP